MKRDTRTAMRYARALVELVDKDSDLDAIDAELASVADWLDSAPEIVVFAQSPVVDSKQRETALQPLFDSLDSELLVRFFKIVLEAGRLPLVQAIATEVHLLCAERQNRAEAVVTSAIPLTKAQQKKLADVLSRRINKEVVLRTEVDPAVLGGVRVQVGNLLLDGTVRTAMSKLKAALSAQ